VEDGGEHDATFWIQMFRDEVSNVAVADTFLIFFYKVLNCCIYVLNVAAIIFHLATGELTCFNS
jgi:hypothetical protein